MVRLLRPARESNALAEREQLQRIVPRPEISAFQYSAFGEVGNGAGMKVFGAGDGIRTRDIDLGKVALYQLSYSRPGETSFSTKNKMSVKRCGNVTENTRFINLRKSPFAVLEYRAVKPARRRAIPGWQLGLSAE